MRVTLKRSLMSIALSLFTIGNLSSFTALTAVLAGVGILSSLKSAGAQTITGGTYTATAYSPSVVPFQNLTSGTLAFTNNNVQSGAAAVSLGISFNFFGATYTNINIGVDGVLSFGNNPITSGANVNLEQVAVSAPTIAVLWDDWRTQGQPSDGSNVTYRLLGDTAGSRRFVVQWNNLRNQNTGAEANNGATFQAVLYETSNKILFAYNDLDVGNTSLNNGASATIGISNYTSAGNASQRLQWSVNTPFSGYSVCFSPGSTNPATPATCP
ncbi:hypothetical protein [Leptolyngbya sp. GGD]|uniref:hypothetical protein n=1 Tax=Leptolyngbya sp. GGD TaxID=2997907 RepID=UPI00227CD5DB|nr:hypothetical protein [Leptolyngbya sp. GGD]MCY6489297.1 hypothetical protein [Leptolyngbya sp. GGD]